MEKVKKFQKMILRMIEIGSWLKLVQMNKFGVINDKMLRFVSHCIHLFCFTIWITFWPLY